MEGDEPLAKQHVGEAGRGLFASCSFSDLGLHPTLCHHLQDAMGFQVPTKVQAEVIPVVISGQHLLVNAATGTGKTIAFLAPIIHLLQVHIPCVQRSHGTFALVMVPTRELCMQVYDILRKLLHRFHWIVPGYIMGGENRSKEKARLRKGISILIATPGRLLDHLKHTSAFTYSNLRWIVFDEADRILELGYGKAIEEILDFLNSRKNELSTKEKKEQKGTCLSKRQNLLLSATLNEKVNHLAKISLDSPVMIGLDVKSSPEPRPPALKIEEALPYQMVDSYKLPEQLVQKYLKVPCGSRLAVLLSILRTLFEREVYQKIVVFFSTCDAVDFHHSLLSQFCLLPNIHHPEEQKRAFVGCKVFRLHGNMELVDRRSSFLGFNAEKFGLLLCTDVAARGLDFPRVRCIIQYDSPGEATEYVHRYLHGLGFYLFLSDYGDTFSIGRVGRTARLGNKGEAILFLQPLEIDYIHDLQKHGVMLKEFPLEKVLDGFLIYKQKYHKNISLEMHPWVLSLQKELENIISSEPELKNLAKKAFCSWVRAYAAHRGELKCIFMVKKLHLGNVAKSFGLKEQPSRVGSSFRTREKKRKQKLSRPGKRKQIAKRSKCSY